MIITSTLSHALSGFVAAAAAAHPDLTSAVSGRIGGYEYNSLHGSLAAGRYDAAEQLT